jgi:hypothetical protein
MRIPRTLLVSSLCLVLLAALAWSQNRKAGLWEITSTMTWQQSPFPAGMMGQMGGHTPFGGGPHTTQICVTQEQIDKYGTVPPQTHGDCQMTNIVKKTNSMTADIVCTGHNSGKGTIAASWTDDEHSTSKMHFLGTMDMGQESRPIEWTVDSSSVYKGADCGNVKPFQAPTAQ